MAAFRPGGVWLNIFPQPANRNLPGGLLARTANLDPRGFSPGFFYGDRGVMPSGEGERSTWLHIADLIAGAV
jgi:hypothetical protein